MHPLGDSISKRAKNINCNSQVMPAKDEVFRDITGLKNKESKVVHHTLKIVDCNITPSHMTVKLSFPIELTDND